MAFRDFTYPEVVAHFGLTEATADLFGTAPPVPPSPEYRAMAARYARLSVGNVNEKAKSEYLIAPLLVELWGRYEDRVNMYSGHEFVADEPAKLSGYCDFLLGLGQQLPIPRAPQVVVIGAKKDDLMDGYGQCIAGMVGLQRFNRAAKLDRPFVYGGVTTGGLWRFMKLEETTLTHDKNEFATKSPDTLLGALVAMLESLLAVTP
jgi:hypothetical protein